MIMKLDRTLYLELCVYHKGFVVGEYPSRFCILRIPFSKISDSLIQLSIGQLRKLIAIGYFESTLDYIVIGHRPFDKEYCSKKEFPYLFRYSCEYQYDIYFDSLFK